MSPVEKAIWHCAEKREANGFEIKFINDYGMFSIFWLKLDLTVEIMLYVLILTIAAKQSQAMKLQFVL